MQVRTREYLAMAKRLDWEKRKFDGRRTTSVADESEFRRQDTAARWLADAERWQERQKGIVAREKRKPGKP